MKLIVGLGNPGQKYKNNRHNVGQMFIDYLISTKGRLPLGQNPPSLKLRRTGGLKLYKTDCFMNLSGIFVKKLIESRLNREKISNLIVVHDDLDIPLGKFKIQMATGPKLHNGIDSIEKELGTKDFLRVRIGVDNRLALSERSESNGWVDGESYVLQDFLLEEKKIILATFPKIYNQLKITLFR